MTDIFEYAHRREIIASRIKDERKNVLDISQEALAAKVTWIVSQGGKMTRTKEISQSTIASWETGKNLPPLDRLIALSIIFDCDIAYLLGDYPQRKRRRDSIDVEQITGLDVNVVSNLKGIKDAVDKNPFKFVKERFFLLSINEVLASDKFLSCLECIWNAHRIDQQLSFGGLGPAYPDEDESHTLVAEAE